MKKKISQYILLTLIVVFGFFIRIYNIGGIPATLNPDEASLGYNAFSILKTGADEHGVIFPLSLQSFGDWKLPVYSYLDVLSIFFFNISKLSVRLPSILAGTSMIILIYFISFEIFKNKKIALLAALFLAINPWSVFFSRGAYEVNVATALFLAGFLSLLLYFRRKKLYLLFITFILFGLTMFTQHNYILFTPLFIAATLILQRKQYVFSKGLVLALSLLLVFIIASFISLASGGVSKASNLNVMTSKNVLYDRADKLRGDGASQNILVEKILYNKVSAGLYQFSLNYLQTFSSSVLFDKGGDRLTHNIGDIGYFYVFDAFLFLSGVFFLTWKRSKKVLLILFPWLLLAPLPSAVTTEPTGTRLFTLAPVIILVSSYGAYTLVESIRSTKGRKVVGAGIALLITISFIYFVNYYFVHFNTQRMSFWKYGYEDAVKIADHYKDYNIVMRGPENFPYVYFLLYDKYDPVRFRNEVVYLPKTREGFLFVKSFGRYKFVDKINYKKLSKKTIYFDDIFDDKIVVDNVSSIKYPAGNDVMKYHIEN